MVSAPPLPHGRRNRRRRIARGSLDAPGVATEPRGLIAGRYQVTRTLGQGAFGRTFLARDTTAGRDVAIKMLDTRRAADWKAFELFDREASVLRSLRHHGIPEVHDTLRERWDDTDAALLVMEYVDGTSLEQLIAGPRPLEPAAVTHILLEMLGILDYLHGRVPPILHRDIKPANIIVRPNGAPALVDFGAVRSAFLLPGESGSTIVGTYGYMPYEQYMGQATSVSDLFALGATMLHLVTRRPPQDFMTPEGSIEVPAQLPGDPRLRELLARLLRHSPAERPQSAADARSILLGASVGAPFMGAPAVAVARSRAATVLLPTGPRELTGDTKELFKRVAPSSWDLMSASTKMTDEGTGLIDKVTFAFFCVITAGVLPAVFFSMSRDRKRRLKRFFRDGAETSATIISMQLEDTAFGEKMMRVRYEFEADGELRRDGDVVLPKIANRWAVGEPVRVLYLPERDYDSVIISTS